MDLEHYHRKRNFGRTPEPRGKISSSNPDNLSFVIQKHEARRPHYDFRLELDGVFLSWALPKGPSLNYADKRMAVRTEDHPLDYGDFEGVIPEKEYGGGTVMLWDRGRWEPKGDPHEGLRKGHLSFVLHGERLHGSFGLVEIREPGVNAWLLIKSRDEHARTEGPDIVEQYITSVDSGLTLDDIAREQARVWTRAGELPGREELLTLPGAIDRDIPWPIAPQLPTLVQQPVNGEEWLHELKLDGYRLLIRLHGGQAEVFTRSGQNWTQRLEIIAQAAMAIPIDHTILDGELVVLDAEGRSSFGELQRAIGNNPQRLYFYTFDLLQAHGIDLREVPLWQRKQMLQRIVPADQTRVRYSDHIFENGALILAHACELKAEGIVSKPRNAPYRSGRGGWLKVKCLGREEFVVGGYITRKDNPLASLLLGRIDDDRLVYVGRTGTGFTQADYPLIRKRLELLARNESPFTDEELPMYPGDQAHWVNPEMLVEVQFSGWTGDGVLRHASFQGIREDKPLPPLPAMPNIRVSNPDKVLYLETGLSKGRIAAWTALMAPWLLPHVIDRPLMLMRCPNGHRGECFFQKHHENLPSPIEPITLPGRKEPYIGIRNAEGLIALIQMGTLEIHPWGARSDRPDSPDRMIFDLDPDSALPFEAVVHAACDMRQRLENFGLRSWVRWTGGKGLHVVVPLMRRHNWDLVRSFSRALAETMSRDEPGRFIATASKEKRKGKIFVDWLRNGFGATAITTWGLRARPGAPVAVPLNWSDLDPEMDLTPYRLPLVQPPTKDPWAGFFDEKQSITQAMRQQLGLKE